MNNVISNPGAFTAGDPVGHGTHVAGIVAGNSAFRTDGLAGKYAGIAPEADIVAIKTADENGNSTVLDVINALQFVVDRKDELNIRVVNLSVSSDTPGSYLLDPLDAAVEFAWHAGIVVVTAAGNRGDAADAVQYAPGNDPYVISVGATDEADDPRHRRRHARDLLEPRRHAGRLRQAGDRRAGREDRRPARRRLRVRALAPATSIFENGQYIRIGGTSMASPVVAGAAALVLQARPDLNPDEVKALLTQTGSRTADQQNSAQHPGGARRAARPSANVGLNAEPDRQGSALLLAGIDPTRATWTRATWTRATWTRATWTRGTLDPRHLDGRAPPASTPRGRVPPGPAPRARTPAARCQGTRSTWSRSTWSRSTWSRSTWSSIEW